MNNALLRSKKKSKIYYRSLRRPLGEQSSPSLPFMLAALAYGFPLKDASHEEDHAFKRG